MADYARYKILAVDDQQLALKLITKQLEVIGFSHIDLVTGGGEALEKLAQGDYDIVIFDWSMPVMHGLTFLRTCRANPAYNDVAFMMVSSDTAPEMVQDALNRGATAYLAKPVVIEELKTAIDSVIAWLRERKTP